MNQRSVIAIGASAALLAVLAFAAYRTLFRTEPALLGSEAMEEEGEAAESMLYGRISTVDGTSYQGRLRWGGNQEAFWGDYFNGAKKENPWAAHVPPRQLPRQRHPLEIFGLEIFTRFEPASLKRPFMARFGDIARIEAEGREVQVILKSGIEFVLDRFEASDFDDGVRVWDGSQGAVDLDSLRIRAIELLPAPHSAAVANRLCGAVRTRRGEFSGFLQWNRQKCLGSDELVGDTDGGVVRLRFDTIRSIAPRSGGSALVALHDGRELVLSGSSDTGQDNRGVYVDDVRYGRVLVPWAALVGVDFISGGSGPAYDDFPPGGPLKGEVTTLDGRRLAGRLVYDLDESDITETLDAPSGGVDYTIPLGLIASIVLPGQRTAQGARITLHSGETVHLELSGDLSDRNTGVLVFPVEGGRSEFVPWSEVRQISLQRPHAVFPGDSGS